MCIWNILHAVGLWCCRFGGRFARNGKHFSTFAIVSQSVSAILVTLRYVDWIDFQVNQSKCDALRLMHFCKCNTEEEEKNNLTHYSTNTFVIPIAIAIRKLYLNFVNFLIDVSHSVSIAFSFWLLLHCALSMIFGSFVRSLCSHRDQKHRNRWRELKCAFNEVMWIACIRSVSSTCAHLDASIAVIGCGWR